MISNDKSNIYLKFIPREREEIKVFNGLCNAAISFVTMIISVDGLILCKLYILPFILFYENSRNISAAENLLLCCIFHFQFNAKVSSKIFTNNTI